MSNQIYYLLIYYIPISNNTKLLYFGTGALPLQKYIEILKPYFYYKQLWREYFCVK